MERVQTQLLMTESAGTAQGVDVALLGGGIERVQTHFLMTENAGTAQGVDVALPGGGAWSVCKPNF